MTTATRPGLMPSQRSARLAGVFAAMAVLLVLAGCNAGHDRQQVRGWLFADPSQRHPIKVSEREVGMDLSVPRGSYGLSRTQKHEAHAFLSQYRQQGAGAILVRAPSGSPNEVAAMRALDDLRFVFRQEGVAGEAVVFEPYYGGGDSSAPLRLSFLRHVAIGPECGDWSTNAAINPSNQSHPNFGCATQRNLAAMVANPRDLVEPRGMTPRSGERRDVVWDKWVKGESSSAERTQEEKASASEIGGGGN